MKNRLMAGGAICTLALAAILVSGSAARVWAQELPANDYPTVARADYVYACMAVNGQTREILEKCSCSIDEIANILPYDQYEQAETLISVGLRGGENVAWTKIPEMQEKVKNLRRAQVEGELRCF
ncbi:MAG: hypothetical protein JSR99_01100 [Proteobacteria bacterium]|nr:hypothetical protein [Pseudomonadota bacterium]